MLQSRLINSLYSWAAVEHDKHDRQDCNEILLTDRDKQVLIVSVHWGEVCYPQLPCLPLGTYMNNGQIMCLLCQCFDAISWVVGRVSGLYKTWLVRYWRGCLSGVRYEWFVYRPGDATATPIISCFIKIQNGLPFWCRLTQVDLEKRLLNGCSCSSSTVVVVVASCHLPCIEPFYSHYASRLVLAGTSC